MTNAEIKRHPLEAFPNAVKTLILPQTGIEVVIRRLDFDAITTDATKTVLSSPAMREAALLFAQEASETLNDGTPKRPRGDLPMEAMLDIQRESERGLLRNAILRPTLDELVALYGGNMEAPAPDLGLGPDFSFLTGEIEAFSKTKVGEPELQQARVFPVVPGDGDSQPGEDVRPAAAPGGETPAGDV